MKSISRQNLSTAIQKQGVYVQNCKKPVAGNGKQNGSQITLNSTLHSQAMFKLKNLIIWTLKDLTIFNHKSPKKT